MPLGDDEIVFHARKFQVVQKRIPNSPEPVRYVIRHPGAVAILAVSDDGRLVFVRNYRVTIDVELLEIPAGTREPGESPQETAIRELKEETGYRAGIWRQLCEFYTSPGITDEKMTLFLAQSLEPGEPQLAPDEHLEPCLLTLDEALAAIRDGTIQDAKTLVAVLTYQNTVRENRHK